jgi:hypothetical protein
MSLMQRVLYIRALKKTFGPKRGVIRVIRLGGVG